MADTHEYNRQWGFTLIELIVVMVVLSILAIGSVQFISFSANAYVQTSQRSELAASASIINEKISRQLRNALPGSVRTNNGGSCVEFIPILAASQYTQAPFAGENNSVNEIRVIPINAVLPQTGYAVIYPLVETSLLYSTNRNPGRISPQSVNFIQQENGVSVYGLTSGFQFEQASPQKRIFFVSEPHTFCQQGGYLFSYQQYGFVGDITNLMSSLPSTLPARKLIADGLLVNSVQFTFSQGSLRRNNLVSYQYTLQQSNEQEALRVNQEVQIRNVP